MTHRRSAAVSKIFPLGLDSKLLGLTVILTLFGLVMIYSASSASAFRDFGDKFYYLRSQVVWAIIGFAVLVFFSLVDYRRFTKYARPIFWISVIFLVLVLFPQIGTKTLGARRWINILGYGFQPAELAKLTSVIYLSSLFAKRAKTLPFVGVSILLSILMIAEPDLGTTVITLASGSLIYFASGAPLSHILATFPVMVLGGLAAILSSSYRRARLMTFFNTELDPLGSSYHARQALLALGSGGLFGVGLGQSRQKYLFLPEVSTDSIFAVIGEELGFIGAAVVIGLFLWMFKRGLEIARASPDKTGSLLALGLTSMLAVQTLVNIGAMVALVPLTGIPLPFISYGGSSLIVSLVAVGILLNISRHRIIGS
jgi:cell division protein FtsW